MKIQIEKPVRPNDQKTNGKDVLTIKSSLNHLGYYEIPSYGLTPYPDKQMFEAIKTFQKDKGFKIDGAIDPAGETIKGLNKGLRRASKSPVIRCPECGGPHGGSKGDLCPDCDSKVG